MTTMPGIPVSWPTAMPGADGVLMAIAVEAASGVTVTVFDCALLPKPSFAVTVIVSVAEPASSSKIWVRSALTWASVPMIVSEVVPEPAIVRPFPLW